MNKFLNITLWKSDIWNKKYWLSALLIIPLLLQVILDKLKDESVSETKHLVLILQKRKG